MIALWRSNFGGATNGPRQVAGYIYSRVIVLLMTMLRVKAARVYFWNAALV